MILYIRWISEGLRTGTLLIYKGVDANANPFSYLVWEIISAIFNRLELETGNRRRWRQREFVRDQQRTLVEFKVLSGAKNKTYLEVENKHDIM